MIVPLRVAVVWVSCVATLVTTVGGTGRVVRVWVCPYTVPDGFVAYALYS